MKKMPYISSESGYILLNFPQAIIRAIDRIFSAYGEGKTVEAHNMILAVLNSLYPTMQSDIKQLIDKIDLAEASYVSLVSAAVPPKIKLDRELSEWYVSLLMEGQAVFDMMRLRALAMAIRKAHIDGMSSPGSLVMGDPTPAITTLERIISTLRVFGKPPKQEDVENLLRLIREIYGVKIRDSPGSVDDEQLGVPDYGEEG